MMVLLVKQVHLQKVGGAMVYERRFFSIDYILRYLQAENTKPTNAHSIKRIVRRAMADTCDGYSAL